MLKEIINKGFLFHEFDVSKGFSRFLDGLTESIFKSIWNIDNVDDFLL